MSARITAAEAATILRDLARGREDGNGGDVWPLYDRAEDAMAAVIGLAAESDAHRTRADATESECARLRGEIAAACAARDEARAVERERCAALCDAAAARWGTAGDRWKRSNEAAALAAEMRAWPVTP